MTRAEIIQGFLDGTIVRAYRGACPVCGVDFERTTKHNPAYTCGARHCVRMANACSTAANAVKAGRKTVVEPVAGQRVNEIDDVTPWVANYGDGYFRSPCAWGF